MTPLISETNVAGLVLMMFELEPTTEELSTEGA
jgi:hypothetical protein